jgi:hypothetical protein
MTKHILG